MGVLNVVAAVVLAVSISIQNIQGREIYIDIDGRKPIHSMHYKSPSFTLEMSIFKYGWTQFLKSKKLLTLVKALGPSYVRMGGTMSNFAYFEPGANSTNTSSASIRCEGVEVDEQKLKAHETRARESVLGEYELRRMHKIFLNLTYTATEFDEFMTFVRCSKLQLIFGLNILDRKNGRWDPANTIQLLQHSKKRRYKIGWELGNEPNAFFHNFGFRLTGEDIAKDFRRLNKILKSDPWWKKSKLFGPDASRTGQKDNRQLIGSFAQNAKRMASAITFHQYYMGSQNATVKMFLEPKVLNSLIPEVKMVVKTVKRVASKIPVWLGETGTSFGGGAAGLSDTFVAGFMWLDKLGISAANGVEMVFRQSLFERNYGLLNYNFDPNPDYWLTLLYKTLVGTRVLNVTSASGKPLTGNVRVYAHCTNTERSNFDAGSVTIYYLNLSERMKRLSFGANQSDAPKKAMSYILTSSLSQLNSSSVLLNNKKLELLPGDTLPELRPREINLERGGKILFPKKSLGFVVLPDQKVSGCL